MNEYDEKVRELMPERDIGGHSNSPALRRLRGEVAKVIEEAVAAERNACAKLVEYHQPNDWEDNILCEIAAAIRAREP